MTLRNKYIIYNYSLIPLEISWIFQKSLVNQYLQCILNKETFLLLKHPIIFTLGHNANKSFLAPNFKWQNSSLHKIERGGEITCHSPGQIVVYMIINLVSYKKDLHWYVSILEGLIIHLLKNYNILASRIKGLTGVWVGEYKIASIGIKISKWLSMYGFSINFCLNLKYFQNIIPCGLLNKKICNVSHVLSLTSEAQFKGELKKILKEGLRHMKMDLGKNYFA
uniref:lipoyl(octanoyl) transferase n=1 Tax=Sciadococcus taiwanensis TaxID=3028030 RepID=A0A9Y1MWW5_9RHOD|nr:lipoate biosynthesis protein B [Sciadococcus taiwanensis]